MPEPVKRTSSLNDTLKADIEIIRGNRISKAVGRQVDFSAFRAFPFEHSKEEKDLLTKILSQLDHSSLGFWGPQSFYDYLCELAPQFSEHFAAVVTDQTEDTPGHHPKLPVRTPSSLPEELNQAETWFIGENNFYRAHLRASLLRKAGRKFLTWNDLIRPVLEDVPNSAWIGRTSSIYPIEIPELRVEDGLDLLLLDLPARNLALMPNGLGYVHNALKKTTLHFQTLDADITAYHLYHTHRIKDAGVITSDKGYAMLEDPWKSEAYQEWDKGEVVDYFKSLNDILVEEIRRARPKILALSLQACNTRLAKDLVIRVREVHPDILVLVGGYSCYQPEIGLRAFPECDYMVIGEADLTIGPLVEALAKGERPTNLPGVLSRFDPKEMIYKPGKQPTDLDAIEMPRYEWTDLSIYQNHNGYQLTPIIASRGCRWSKCTFCAERFFWRVRSPQKVVDEFEFLHDQGCELFMFNESDLNGKPETLVEICREIQRRKLKIKLTGQLRVHKKSDRKFFDELRAGGFVALRFGVDAWSKNTLRLQKKGYTLEMIEKNLRACTEAEIYTEVNTVLGVPGETEADIDETIEYMIRCKPYIGRIANLNTLMLVVGSVYWEDPDRLGIVFRGDKDRLREQYPRYIPETLWHSENPFIDGDVRRERMIRVVDALKKAGFDLNINVKKKRKDAGQGKENQPTLDFERRDGNNDEDPKSRSRKPKAIRKPFEIRAGSGNLENESRAESPLGSELENKRVIAVGGEYFVIDRELRGQHILGYRTLNGLRRLKRVGHPRNLASLFAKGVETFKEGGIREFSRQLRGSVKRTFVGDPASKKDSLNSGEEIKLRKETHSEIQILMDSFSNYRILKAGSRIYGIRRSYNFDPVRADQGDYAQGVCFSGKSIDEVKGRILEHTSGPTI